MSKTTLAEKKDAIMWWYIKHGERAVTVNVFHMEAKERTLRNCKLLAWNIDNTAHPPEFQLQLTPTAIKLIKQ